MNVLLGSLMALWILAPGKSADNDLSCNELRSVIGMVRANSIDVLSRYKLTSGTSYRSRIIYSFKYFEIMSSDAHAANEIFSVLPSNDQQYSVWFTMGDSFCKGEKLSDMKLMDSFGARLPLLLSRAVVAHPKEMQKYIKFSLDAAQDPHSNLLFYMQHVCRVRNYEFKRAVDSLPHSDKLWFVNHLMRADNCQLIALPESG